MEEATEVIGELIGELIGEPGVTPLHRQDSQ